MHKQLERDNSGLAGTCAFGQSQHYLHQFILKSNRIQHFPPHSQQIETIPEETYYFYQGEASDPQEQPQYWQEVTKEEERVNIEVQISDEGQNLKIEIETYDDSQPSERGILVQSYEPYFILNPVENSKSFQERLEKSFKDVLEIKSYFMKSMLPAKELSREVTVNKFYQSRPDHFIWQEESSKDRALYTQSTVQNLKKELQIKNAEIVRLQLYNQQLSTKVGELQNKYKIFQSHSYTKGNNPKVGISSNVQIVLPEQYEVTDRPEKPCISNPQSPQKIHSLDLLNVNPHNDSLLPLELQQDLNQLLRIQGLVQQDLNSIEESLKKQTVSEMEVFNKVIVELDRQVKVIDYIARQLLARPIIVNKQNQDEPIPPVNEYLTSLGRLTKDVSQPLVQNITHNIKFSKASKQNVSTTSKPLNDKFKRLNLEKLHNHVQDMKMQHDGLRRQSLHSRS